VIRQGWLRYRVLMGDPILPVSSPATCDGGEVDPHAGLRLAVRFLEKTLATHYDQWLNFFDFWPVASRD
jgi:hypothetical protein